MHVRRLAVLALLVALAGCNGSEADPPDASPSPSVTTTAPTPDPTPTSAETEAVQPTPSAEAETIDEAGAEAFAVYYWELVNYAQATGDVDRLSATEGFECDACVGGRRWIEKIYKRGGHYEGGVFGPIHPQAIRTDSSDPESPTFAVEIETEVTDGAVVTKSGQRTQQTTGGPIRLSMVVSFHEVSGWRVTQWEIDG